MVIFSEVKSFSFLRKIRLKKKSLRLLIFSVLVLLGMIPIVACTRILLTTAVMNELTSRSSRIQNQWMIVANQVTRSGYLDNTQNDVVDAQLSQMASLQDGRAIVINASFKIVKDTYETDKGKYNISEVVMKCFQQKKALSKYSSDYLEFVQPVFSADGSQMIGCILLTSSRKSLNELSEKLTNRIRIVELLAFVVIVILALLISSWIVDPYKKLALSINKASENPLGSDALVVDDFLETQQVADAYNKTLQRLKTLDESRQQFVSNVSHELKTPIASIRVLADSLINQENLPVEIYQEFMTDISEEVERESNIIDDLLTLVKMDKASTGLNVTQININEILEAILKRLRPIAIQKNVELVLESFRPVLAEIDKTKFSLAVTNLVENAIKYNRQDGWVRVSLNADHKFFYIKVQDSGCGIPEEDQEKVFERFYRVDKARSREAGGTGLGLAITKSIVQAHHGEIKVFSKENEGTTFTVRIPLIYIE